MRAFWFDLKPHDETVDVSKFRCDSILQNKYCTGCSACVAACPKSAVFLDENSEGFLIAKVNLAQCISCGICTKVCPTINAAPNKRYVKANCYAAQASDDIRSLSSSGGVFTVVAEYVLDKGGVVCAAAWREQCIDLTHIFVEEKSQIDKLRLSKYVQSDLSGIFPKLRTYLKAGRLVLFVGTPCQIAGLKRYLHEVPKQLLTIDVVCCGVPSRKVYRKFLEEEVSSKGAEVTSMTFRNKDNGWRTRAIKVGVNGSYICQKNNASAYEQLHFRGISTNLCCTECPFDTFSREGDITLGDFWGIEEYAPSLDDNLGTSLVLVNTPKAKLVLDLIAPRLKLLKKVPQSWALKGNSNLIKPISSKFRRQFFFEIGRYSIRDAYSRCVRDQADVIIFNNAITSVNYGSMLTAYAAQEIFMGAGFYAKTLNHARVPVHWSSSSFAKNFADQYLNLTDPCQTDSDFILLNSKSNVFIVGSDQMWRTLYWKSKVDKILLSFVDTSKRRIACAMSFGMDEFEGTELEKEQFRAELKYYHCITVRESTGVDILNKEFGVSATWVLDPVFILDPAIWNQMANKSKFACKGKLVCYGWRFSGHELEAIRRYAISVGCDDVVNLTFSNHSVEDWLNAIRTAKVVVSDSYHCICFAIIFQRSFVGINNIGQGRFNSLKHLFGISNCFVGDTKNIISGSIPEVNYEHVSRVLNKERDRSRGILVKAVGNE